MVSRTQPLLAEAPRRLCSSPQDPPPEEGARDPETFDDSDFYQQLLKEFLEASTGAGVRVPVPAAPSKKKKNVRDRRASKGRRLRYDVQVCRMLGLKSERSRRLLLSCLGRWKLRSGQVSLCSREGRGGGGGGAFARQFSDPPPPFK